MFGRPYLYPDTMSGFLSGHSCLVRRNGGARTSQRDPWPNSPFLDGDDVPSRHNGAFFGAILIPELKSDRNRDILSRKVSRFALMIQS
jgi:hypothetical protein